MRKEQLVYFDSGKLLWKFDVWRFWFAKFDFGGCIFPLGFAAEHVGNISNPNGPCCATMQTHKRGITIFEVMYHFGGE